MAFLLNGTDAAGDLGLWLTDGTAGTTTELTPISGANATGIFHLISPAPLPDITRLNPDIDLFVGYDNSNKYGLWVSNGTATGTKELTGIGGANSGGIFNGIGNPGFTKVINVGGTGTYEELFAGVDTSGLIDLW